MRKIPTLSLFSGAGGLDIGFHQIGFEIIGAVEIEPAYAETLTKNTGEGRYFGPGLEVHCVDIREFDVDLYANSKIEIVIGGPPCQTFSAAGRRSGGVLGLDDDRGNLFREYVAILERLKPKAFVFENVYGLPGANGGEPWRQINKAFERAGYKLHAEILDAADYGAPQHRERLIMVGMRDGSFSFPAPTHGPDAQSGNDFLTAREAIADIADPDELPSEGPGGLYGHLLPLVPPGLNYSYFTSEMGHPEPQFAWRSKFHDFLHKANPDSPVRTIKSKPGKFTGPFHWNNRHFTAAELKRLQSFPDDYEITGSYNKVVEQVGNSVPPALAMAVARAVRAQVFDDTHFGSLALREPGFASSFRRRQRERSAEFKEVARESIERIGVAASQDLIFSDSYLLGVNGHFDRHFDIQEQDRFERVFTVELRRAEDQIHMDVERVGKANEIEARIEIAGLTKYMSHTESLSVTGQIADIEDLLPVWACIERELVRQSRFFTLIDIYGHYANRGDVVEVNTSVRGETEIAQAISYVGSSVNCGRALPAGLFTTQMGLPDADAAQLVTSLRELRFDARTRDTHGTLASGSILVTYPFPSLSSKAHFK